MKLLFSVLAALCVLAAPLPALSSPSPFSGKTITAIVLKDENGNPWMKPDQILELIGVKPGDTFSGSKIRSGLALLYLKGVFRDIRVDGFPEDSGVRLEYTFISITVVDKVVVHGNSSVSTSVIEEALPRLAGKELRESKLPGIKADLIALYQALGFFEASAAFRVERLDKPNHVVLHVDITEGKPTVIEKITFEGNTVFKDRALLAVMKSRINDPLNRDLLLDRDAEAIVKKYTDAGYPAAKIGPVAMSFHEHKADIRITCSEGPRVTVRFTGNREFSSGKLNKTLLIWSEHDISDTGIDSSADKIKTMYREQGFADADVDVKKTAEPGRLDLEFIITEGPQVTVRQIVLQGNTVFPSKKIKKEMALREPGWFNHWYTPWITSHPFREDQLNTDVDNLRDRYLEAGYLSVTVKKKVTRSADGREAFVTIDITEGPQSKTGAITFEGNTVFSAKDLSDKLSLKSGAPFNERLLDEDKYRIISAYSNKGYLYAQVDVDRTPQDDTIAVRYRITEDKQVRIGRIILKGNERTKDYVIMRELLVKPGDPYDYGAILSSQQRIYRLGYFRLAKFEPVHPGEKDYLQDMLLTVEEGPAGYGEVSFGYGDLDKLRGSIEVGYRNLWGTAEYTSLRYEQSDILKRAIYNYRKPWFLDYRLDANFSLIWSDSERLNSDTREVYYKTRKTAVSFGVEKSYEHFKPSLTYQFENVVNYDVLQAAMITPDDSGRVLVSSITPAVLWDLRDDIFNPHKGALFGIALKDALSILESQADFIKLTVQGSWFLPLNSSVLAFSARGGAGWPFRSTPELPLHERFYVGGSTTVRGFTQDSIGPAERDSSGNLIPQGGQSMAIFNLELRLNPGEGVGLVFFVDAGNAWPGQEILFGDLRSSYGIGIRYGTPIGPFRLDYGQKTHQRVGESPGEVHFNIGNTF
jgi:outer membrane protein insertion porin family